MANGISGGVITIGSGGIKCREGRPVEEYWKGGRGSLDMNITYNAI